MRVIGQVGSLRAIRRGRNQNLGFYVEYEYRGTPSYADSIFGQVSGISAESEVSSDGTEGVVRARYAAVNTPGGEEQVNVEVRLSWNAVQKSIFEPAADGYTADLTDNQLIELKEVLAANDDAAYSIWASTASQAELTLFYLAYRGVEYRNVFQPVLTQVTTASGNYIFPDQNANIGAVIDRASMLAALRTDPKFTTPQNPGTAPAGFTYGWKFMPPEYESNSDGRSSEVMAFEFGLWSNFLEPSL